jgi:hypothetical protein
VRERVHNQNTEPRVLGTSWRCLQVSHSPAPGPGVREIEASLSGMMKQSVVVPSSMNIDPLQ